MWPNEQFPADLVTFTEGILKGKLNFLCSVMNYAALDDVFSIWEAFLRNLYAWLSKLSLLSWEISSNF